MMKETIGAAVFAQTNDERANELVVFARDGDGRLEQAGRHRTGGRGNGMPHLPSQGSIAVDGDRLLLANAGSNEISLFEVGDGVVLVSTVPSGGERPVSITIRADRVYVLNAGSASISGFMLSQDGIVPVEGAQHGLPAGTDGAQIAYTPAGDALVVTDRATDSIIVVALDEAGLPREMHTYPASGVTPYGFDFAGDVLVVTEAFGGMPGRAAAATYRLDGGLTPVSGSVGSSRSEVCWAVVSADGRHVWVTNFGDGTISRYAVGAGGSLELVDAVAGTTIEGVKGVRDAARSGDGRFLYALDADARQVFAFRISDDGSLVAIGNADGLPDTVAGLAAR
jgi:6-phosphogluconolactonase (cycloisomerase 2 family)